MKQYIYLNNALRFRIDDAPFPYADGVFAELQEQVSVLMISRWVSRDSRILTIAATENVQGNVPRTISNYDGTITEMWNGGQFNLKDRLREIAKQYTDSIAAGQYMRSTKYISAGI